MMCGHEIALPRGKQYIGIDRHAVYPRAIRCGPQGSNGKDYSAMSRLWSGSKKSDSFENSYFWVGRLGSHSIRTFLSPLYLLFLCP